MDFAMHQKELRMRVYTYIEFSTVQESQFIYYVQNCALLPSKQLICHVWNCVEFYCYQNWQVRHGHLSTLCLQTKFIRLIP